MDLVPESDVSGRHVEQVDIQSLEFPEHPLHDRPAFAELLALLLQPGRSYVVRKLQREIESHLREIQDEGLLNHRHLQHP